VTSRLACAGFAKLQPPYPYLYRETYMKALLSVFVAALFAASSTIAISAEKMKESEHAKESMKESDYAKESTKKKESDYAKESKKKKESDYAKEPKKKESDYAKEPKK
jgi:mannitol-specific phosphotransferase system IIBC component